MMMAWVITIPLAMVVAYTGYFIVTFFLIAV
jgi:phosphate/sulfate permease